MDSGVDEETEGGRHAEHAERGLRVERQPEGSEDATSVSAQQEERMDDEDKDEAPAIQALPPIHMMAQPNGCLRLWSNMSANYYVTADFSPETYALLAYNGFISVAHHLPSFGDLLLPELQFKYAIMDLEDLRVERSARKRARKKGYTLTLNQRLDEVLAGIERHHEGTSWVLPSYQRLMRTMLAAGEFELPGGQISQGVEGKGTMQVVSVELVDEQGQLAAGEIGYIIGATYTSLTGFFDSTTRDEGGRLEHRSAGKIQLVALGKLLRRLGFAFWSLGHPPRPDAMQYKADIGAHVLSRKDFLTRWVQARDLRPSVWPTLPMPPVLAAELMADVGLPTSKKN